MDPIDSISDDLFEPLGSKTDLDHSINNVFLNQYSHDPHDHDHSGSSHTRNHIELESSSSGHQPATLDPLGHRSDSVVLEISLDSNLHLSRFNPYNPSAKPRRLGRPRKHYQPQESPSDLSSLNLNHSIISKFRFDNQPIEGPGSRGGKLERSIPRGKITMLKKKQSKLPFEAISGMNFQTPDDTPQGSPEVTSTLVSSENVQTQLKQEVPIQHQQSKHIDQIEQTPLESQAVASTTVSDNIPHLEPKLESVVTNTDLVKDLTTIPNDISNHPPSDIANPSLVPPTQQASAETKPDPSEVNLTKSHSTEESSALPEDIIAVGDSKPAPKKRATRTRTPSKKITQDETEERKPKPKKTTKKKPKAASPKKRLKQEEQSSKKLKTSKIVSTSRTTVLNTSHKISRQLPGPLVGLFYDLYDDNILDAEQNIKAKSEKIAFGFPVTKNPYASDILFIIEFLNKFYEVVKFPNVSPQDIEKGLSLPPASTPPSEKYFTKPPSLPNPDQIEEYDPNYISSKMKFLFLRLMGMVLNRKREVTSHSSAILELKPLAVNLGLPAEWRVNKVDPSEVEDEPSGSPVDPHHPDVITTKIYKQGYSIPTFNPFVLPEFEQLGLEALEPKNRLILLRILVQWSLSSSDALKSYIFRNSQNTDIPGDKETFYASRAILKGFKNAMDTKVEAEAKFNKREDDVKFIDPTSDPLEHCFRIRIHEELAGDAGFHIGRFYLCRMADKSNGGLASMKKMSSVWAGPANAAIELPSNFKLFVQDVHEMLVKSLEHDGVEFNDKGNQLNKLTPTPSASESWYEVASNVEELSIFVNFLSRRLGYTGTEEDDIVPMTSMIYRPMINLFNYLSSLLPLLIRQDQVSQVIANQDEPRATRQKGGVNYNDRVASQHGYFEDPEEEVQGELEEDFEEYDEAAEGPSEDDDYMD